MVNIDYLYNPKFVQPCFKHDRFVDKKLGFQVIEHGTILPHKDIMVNGKRTMGKGGIVDSKGEFIKSSHAYQGAGEAYTPPPESIQHSSETVIYLGIFYPVWGHCMTDDIRRIWFLKSEFMKQFKNCPIVYVPWENRPLRTLKDFIRLLEVLEVDVYTLRPITQPIQFDKVILPDESFYFERRRLYTNKYRETIDQVRSFALKNRTPISNKKIYFYHGLRQFGEERMAEYFKSKGYEIITPEKRADFDEEINLLINAESFGSTLGSCAQNSAFLRDNTETIFIPRAANEFTDYQQAINKASCLNANYVDSSLSIYAERRDCFCYIISEQLKNFFGDKWNGYEEEDFKIFLQYIKHCMSKKQVVLHENTEKYYAPIFSDFIAQLKQREDLIKVYDIQSHLNTLGI